MSKRALWSKILVAVALILTVRGWVPFLGWYIDKETSLTVGVVSGANYLMLGNILAFIGAILNKSSRRKLVLWGVGGIAAGTAFGIARVTFAALTDKELPVPPIIISAGIVSFNLFQILVIIGAILILLEPRHAASPPSPGS